MRRQRQHQRQCFDMPLPTVSSLPFDLPHVYYIFSHIALSLCLYYQQWQRCNMGGSGSDHENSPRQFGRWVFSTRHHSLHYISCLPSNLDALSSSINLRNETEQAMASREIRDTGDGGGGHGISWWDDLNIFSYSFFCSQLTHLTLHIVEECAKEVMATVVECL